MWLHAILPGLLALGSLAGTASSFIVPFDDEFIHSELADLRNSWEAVNVTHLTQALKNDHPHSKLTTPEVIELYGYKTETHTVDSDGYLLTVHRITGNKTHPSPSGKPAVLLMHGLLCSSMDWVIAGPSRGLGFLLADAGYDVWMGNSRGNKYSRKHKRLGSSKEYWTFSWHEMGTYDLPDMIDYILENTGSKKVFFIGHSQGATAFFVMGSERPEYNDKIAAAISLAPVTYSTNLFSPIFKILSKFVKQMKKITDIIGLYEFLANDKFVSKYAKKICNDNAIPPEVCVNAIFVFTGFNAEQFDMDLFPAIISHVPAGGSLYQMYHYAQVIKSGDFQKFDYGLWGNFKKYKTFTPPKYKVQAVTAPVYLHYSNNDWLAHPIDVKMLQSKLPNMHKLTCVSDNKFNHLDFLWAKDVKALLYEDVLDVLSVNKKQLQM